MNGVSLENPLADNPEEVTTMKEQLQFMIRLGFRIRYQIWR